MFKLNATKIISHIKNNNYRLILSELEDGRYQILTIPFAIITDDMEFINKIKQEAEKWANKKKLHYISNKEIKSFVFDEKLPYDLYVHTEIMIKNYSFFIDSNGGLHVFNTKLVEMLGLREAFEINVDSKSTGQIRYYAVNANYRYEISLMPIQLNKTLISGHKQILKSILDYCENDGAN